MKRTIAFAGALTLALASPASAQTYRDANGTIIPGVVPLGGCVAGGNCAGPAGSGSTVAAGQVTCTTSAAALPSQALANGIVVKAGRTNVATVYVGPSGVTTATGYPLAAGEAISYAVSNLSAIYLICANTTDTVAYTGN